MGDEMWEQISKWPNESDAFAVRTRLAAGIFVKAVQFVDIFAADRPLIQVQQAVRGQEEFPALMAHVVSAQLGE